MKNLFKDKKKIFLIFAFVTLLILSVYLVNKEMQNDTFYTIKVGEVIDKYGVDMKDHFSFIPNLKYTYPHWLFDLIIFKIYNIGGFKGLLIFEGIVTYLLSIVLFLTTRKITKNDSISFMTTVFTLAFFKPYITIRGQLISYLILLLILFMIELTREHGKKRYIVFIALLSILLANTHCAMYPTIFILFLPYLVSDLFYVIKNKLFKNKKDNNYIIEIDKPKNTKLLFLEILVVIICGFLTLCEGTYTYIILISMGNSMSLIAEHAASSMTTNPFIFLFIGLFILLLLTKKVKIKLHDLFLILGFILMSLMSVRSFALFLILTVYSFGRILSVVEKNYLKHITLNDVFYLSKAQLFIFLFIALASSVNIYDEAKKSYVNEQYYPVSMVKYIKENIDYENMILFNEYNYGSYILFNDIKVFIDSRSDLYMKEFNKGVTVFEDEAEMVHYHEKYFDKYGFTHALVKNNSTMKKILELRSDFELIQIDDYFSLFEKRISTNV